MPYENAGIFLVFSVAPENPQTYICSEMSFFPQSRPTQKEQPGHTVFIGHYITLNNTELVVKTGKEQVI